MIGLYDPNLYNSPSLQLYQPNLEIMKLGAYYSQEEGQFCHLILPGEDMTCYDKIFCYSEFPVEVPESLKRQKNVDYGGPGFTNGIYIPFKNSLIDFTLPSSFMYKDFLRKCGRSPKVINDFLDDSYCRLYAGDDRLPITKVNSRCRIYLYDTNIIHGDWQSILSSINKRTTSGIYCIHPVTCTGLGQFFTLRRYQKFSRSNKIILDIDVPQEDIRLLFSKYTNKFLADITLASKVYLPIGGAFSSPSGYYKNFIYAVDLLFCFWARGIPMKLWYRPPAIGKRNPIENLTKMVEWWSLIDSPQKRGTSIKDRISKNDELLIEESELLIRNFPEEVKSLMNQSWDSLQRRKYWR